MRGGPIIAERGRARSDNGASTLEFALLTPVLLITILLVVQFAFAYHAKHVALAAAQEGARVARTDDTANWQADTRLRVAQYVAKVGPRLLEHRRAHPVDDPATGQRGVIVTGYAVNVVPFLKFHVRERSVGPRECFRPVGTECGVANP